MNQLYKPKKPTQLEILKRQRTQLKLQIISLKKSNIFSEEDKKELQISYQVILEAINKKIILKNNP